MTRAQEILDFLRTHQQSYDDDQLSELLNIKPRQHVYNICRRLEDQGKIERRTVPKIRSQIKR